MSASTITVKLRDIRTTPPPTCTFVLPVARLIHTSAYFLASPLSRHRDGIFRLNFPDFKLFEIYAEWLSSGEIFTKAGLACLHSLSKSGSKSRSRTKQDLREKARAAYIDYLGAWFLGSWVKATTFKDSLVSLIVEKMEDVEGHPREFVRCLTPSLVDVVFEGGQEGDAIRRFMFEAIKKFGTQEDMEGFVPNEGGEEYPRAFVRGLLVYLHGVGSGYREEDKEDYGIGTSSTASTATESSHGMRSEMRAKKEEVNVNLSKGDMVTNAMEILSTATFTTVWELELPDTPVTNSDLTLTATIKPKTDLQHSSTSIYDSETDIMQTATTTTDTHSQSISTSTLSSGSDFTQTATATTSSNHIPPPFKGPMENIWSPASHVSWPSTATASKASSSGYISQDSSSTVPSFFTAPSLKSKIKHRESSWPRTLEEQCIFHEHSVTGELCYRNAGV
jgi:hypothetical protein